MEEETLRLFVEDSLEHLDNIEESLLAIESPGGDSELVNNVFRAIHSVKGGAGFLNLTRIKELSHSMENVLNRIRNHELEPQSEVISTLLAGADTLKEMIRDTASSDTVDITAHMSALQQFESDDFAAVPHHAEDDVSSEAAELDATDDELADLFESELANSDANSEADSVLVIDCELLQRELNSGYVFRIDYSGPEDIEGKERSINDVLAQLSSLGTVLASGHSVDGSGELKTLAVIVSTIVEPDMMADVVDVKAEACTVLDESAVELYANPVPIDVAPTKSTKAAVKKAPAKKAAAKAAPKKSTAPKAAAKPAVPPPAQPAPKSPPVSRPVRAAAPRPNDAEAASAKITPESTLRVGVTLLDKLMNLAGELVLTRNQLLQAIHHGLETQIEHAAQRLDLITTEMQEAITSTRMQPVGMVFSKFRRIVRDMANSLGKNIELQLDGEEVELDKTIIEGLSDPLTHLVRNAVDHGIETEDERAAAGKSAAATLTIAASHEAGQVLITISDDGRGIDTERVKAKALETGLRDQATLDSMSHVELVNLIFEPGFSTAKEVTDISGRGVGMDVVNTNLTRLGGVVEIDSELGRGTQVRIKLPLTLAIIPSLMVGLSGRKYAIPQVNVQELVRIPAKDVDRRLSYIGDSSVMWLRGEPVPLIQLSDVLHVKTYYDEEGLKEERRQTLHSRRATEFPANPEDADHSEETDRRLKNTRRESYASGVNVVVVVAGTLRYGMVVDALLDSEEIVVKPVGKRLQESRIYAGATIQGDGKVAMILDVVEVGRLAKLDEYVKAINDKKVEQDAHEATIEKSSLLLVKAAEHETFAVPVGLIVRIEKIKKEKLEYTDNRCSINYQGETLLLYRTSDLGNFAELPDLSHYYIVIFTAGGREVGLLFSSIVDTVNIAVEFDRDIFSQPGVFGSAVINDQTTLLLDPLGIVQARKPGWFEEQKNKPTIEEDRVKTIAVAEDSSFFRAQMKRFLEEEGFDLIIGEDGMEALEKMRAYTGPIDALITDIEMPRMNGLELSREVRADQKFSGLPIIAVTSVAGELNEKIGKEAGIDDYLIKLDRELILKCLWNRLGEKRTA